MPESAYEKACAKINEYLEEDGEFYCAFVEMINANAIGANVLRASTYNDVHKDTFVTMARKHVPQNRLKSVNADIDVMNVMSVPDKNTQRKEYDEYFARIKDYNDSHTPGVTHANEDDIDGHLRSHWNEDDDLIESTMTMKELYIRSNTSYKALIMLYQLRTILGYEVVDNMISGGKTVLEAVQKRDEKLVTMQRDFANTITQRLGRNKAELSIDNDVAPVVDVFKAIKNRIDELVKKVEAVKKNIDDDKDKKPKDLTKAEMKERDNLSRDIIKLSCVITNAVKKCCVNRSTTNDMKRELTITVGLPRNIVSPKILPEVRQQQNQAFARTVASSNQNNTN